MNRATTRIAVLHNLIAQCYWVVILDRDIIEHVVHVGLHSLEEAIQYKEFASERLEIRHTKDVYYLYGGEYREEKP